MNEDGSSGDRQTGGVTFWIGVAIGAGLMYVGIDGLLRESGRTAPGDLWKWAVGLLVVHDAVIAPMTLAVAWLVGRWVRGALVWPIRAGLAVSAVIIAVAWPLYRGYGRTPRNDSTYVLDYGANLAWSLVGIWVCVAVSLAVIHRRSSRRLPKDVPTR